MQFEIAKSVLENILIHAQPFLEKKDLSQITSHLYFEATASNTLTVKATDYEIGIVIGATNINVISGAQKRFLYRTVTVTFILEAPGADGDIVSALLFPSVVA